MSETFVTDATAPENAPVVDANAHAAQGETPPQHGPSTSTILDDEQKPAETPPEQKDGEQKPPAELDLKLPDNFQVDEQKLSRFKELAVAKGFSNEEAQELLDVYVKDLEEVGNASTKLWLDYQNQWKDEIRNDPEIGRDNFASMKATVAKALDQFGDKDVRAALALTGAGNNPAIVRLIYKMGKALTEGGYHGGKPAEEPSDFASRIWPGTATG